MSDFVVDTNVWVMVDKVIEVEKLSLNEIRCIRLCQKWLTEFRDSDSRLIVDGPHPRKILLEYRQNIAPKGFARSVLNQLERAPRERVVEMPIEFDEHGFAVLTFTTSDRKDRKFIAVALAHDPTPPIVEATDTHWEQDKEVLTAAGITVQELCPEYIQEKRL